MKQPVFFVVAAILALIGLVWIFQGVGVIKGSFMTGDITWTYVGIGFVIAATAFFWLGTRKRSRTK